MGVALNMALNVGVMIVFNLIITLIYKLVNKYKEAAQAAQESAEKYKKQTDAMKDLVSQYEAILDSEQSVAEKTEELNTWKQTLIETYGFEKEALENINFEREKSIALLKEEANIGITEGYHEYLNDNEKEIQKANKKLGISGEFNIFTGSQIDLDDNLEYGVAKELQKYFSIDADYYFGQNLNNKLSFEYNDSVDELSKLEEIQNKIYDIEAERKVLGKSLSEDERVLKEYVDSEIDRINKLNEKHLAIYETSGKASAWIKFFTDANQNSLEVAKGLGEEAYISWREGFLKQSESESEKREMVELLKNNVSDYETYFEKYSRNLANLSTAKSKFGVSGNINNAADGAKLAFINSLSEEDLDILVNQIEEPFKNGLDGATALIEAWKNDPNNTITANVDSIELEDLATTIENTSKKTKLITSAMAEMADTGYLSSTTYAELIELGGNFTECLEIQSGKLVLNVEKLKELEEQEYKNKISANELTMAELRLNAVSIAQSGGDVSGIVTMIDNLSKENAVYQTLIDEIENANPTEKSSSSSKAVAKSVTDFENALANYQHEINMGRQEEDANYYNWLLQAAHTAYDGLADYQNELYKYEEEVYKGRKKLEDDLFQKRMDNYEKIADKALEDKIDDKGNSLTVTGSFDFSKSQIENAIKETQNRINGIKAGTISGNNDDIENLIDDLDGYYDKIKDINEKAIDSEKDYWDSLKENFEDTIDTKIDQIEKISDAVEDSYDKQITAIDKQIDALDKVADTEERRKKIADSKSDYEKAKIVDSQNTRIVVGSNGVSVKTTTEAQDEAKKNLEEVLRDEQVNILNEQKDLLEEQKDIASEYYDTVKTTLEDEKDKRIKSYDAITEILDNINEDKKQTTSNTELINNFDNKDEIQKAINSLSGTDLNTAVNTGVVIAQDNGKYTVDFQNLSDIISKEITTTDNLITTIKSAVTEIKPENNDKLKKVNGGTQMNLSEFDQLRTDKGLLKDTQGVTHRGYEYNDLSEMIEKNPYIDKMLDYMNKFNNYYGSTPNLANAIPISSTQNNALANKDLTSNYSKDKLTPNIVINIDGSADEKTVKTMSTMLNNQLSEYTDYLTKTIKKQYNKN